MYFFRFQIKFSKCLSIFLKYPIVQYNIQQYVPKYKEQQNFGMQIFQNLNQTKFHILRFLQTSRHRIIKKHCFRIRIKCFYHDVYLSGLKSIFNETLYWNSFLPTIGTNMYGKSNSRTLLTAICHNRNISVIFIEQSYKNNFYLKYCLIWFWEFIKTIFLNIS